MTFEIRLILLTGNFVEPYFHATDKSPIKVLKMGPVAAALSESQILRIRRFQQVAHTKQAILNS